MYLDCWYVEDVMYDYFKEVEKYCIDGLESYEKFGFFV